MRVHNALNELESNRPISAKARQFILEIERAAFDAAYSATGAANFSEFAPTISEDFGLLARGLCYDFQDAWLSGLAESYRRGTFPCGRLQQSPKSLVDLIHGA